MFKLKSRHGGLPRRHGPRSSPGNRAGSGIAQQRLCRVAIRRDLGRQRVHAVELRSGADECVKGDVDVLAIKVAGKVEETRFELLLRRVAAGADEVGSAYVRTPVSNE